MISIKPFYMFILTISIYTKFNDASKNNNIISNNNNNEISLNNYESIVNNDQNSTNSTSILIKSGELLKKKDTYQDDSFQIDFIESEITIPIQMNNNFLVFISCALLVLGFINVLTF
ncbi:hypothetical protein ACTFIY_009054 [Dictyostelium cf. discoideum]